MGSLGGTTLPGGVPKVVPWRNPISIHQTALGILLGCHRASAGSRGDAQVFPRAQEIPYHIFRGTPST